MQREEHPLQLDVVRPCQSVNTPGTEVAPGSDEVGVNFEGYGVVRVGAAFNGITIGD